MTVNQVESEVVAAARTSRAMLAMLLLFCAGLASVWAVPALDGINENRRTIEFPTITPQSLLQQSTYAQIDLALREQLGAESYIAHGIAFASVHIFGSSPTAAVYVGGDGERFLTEDFTNPCKLDSQSLTLVGEQLTAKAAKFATAGTYLLFVIAPDKSSIRSSLLGPFASSLIHCTESYVSYFESLARSSERVPLVTLWAPLRELEQQTNGTYLHTDSHWNWYGSSVLTQEVLNRLVADGQATPGILDDLDELTPGVRVSGLGDLDAIMGLRPEEVSTVAAYHRLGVVSSSESDTAVSGRVETRWVSTSSSSELVPGRTLIYGDSFLGYVENQLAPFFEDVTFAHVDDRGAPGELVQRGNFDRVIVQRVQRYASIDLAAPLPME